MAKNEDTENKHIENKHIENKDTQNIAHIQYIVNQFLYLEISPPKTSGELMNLFREYRTKDEIIEWFNNGRIIWIKDYLDPTPNNEYQNSMNESMILYLNN